VERGSHWNPRSWEQFHAQQLPSYPDPSELGEALAQLQLRPPLVLTSEIMGLRKRIGDAGQGNQFIIQAGECAERFIDCRPEVIEQKLNLLLELSDLACKGIGKPVVTIGRLAGQFGKPRSEESEVRGDEMLPVYRGDIINGFEFSSSSRRPNPFRMLDAYQCAATTLEKIRALESRRSTAHSDSEIALYSSHEALLLPFESALTHWSDSVSGYFNQGAHFLWLGERTRQIDGAHVEYLRGIQNPIGIKVGPTISPEELTYLIKRLNPENEWGRITLITRLGAEKTLKLLPGFITAVRASGMNVTWSCDPMHGNIVRMSDGLKTRYFDSIMSEVLLSQKVHHESGSWLAGLHLESTAEDVTECVGGEVSVREEQLALNYQTYCDPRLNYSQSLELVVRFCDSFRRLLHREVDGASVNCTRFPECSVPSSLSAPLSVVEA
jgi:3-deoxy-7-phosphoheptulonate synthase